MTKQHKKSRSQNKAADPAYHGKLKPASIAKQLSTFKKFGSYVSPATSTAGGVMANAFVVSPSTLNDWGNLQNDWTEYRILAWKVEFIPSFEDSFPSSTAQGGLLIGVIDRTSSTTALSSTQQALEYEGAKYGSINKRLMLEAKAHGTNEMAWVNITTSSYWASVRFYSTALTASTNYGNLVVSILTEFRSAL